MAGPSAGLIAATPDALALRALAGLENFSVAPAFVGARTRERLNAIYGFARLVGTLGDELAADRLAALDWLEQDLDRVYGGTPEHPAMARLVPPVRELELPRRPFVRLIDANRRDQRQSTYATFGDLVDYCDLSANPVGELVLHVFRVATPERVALSDSVCTALQLLEHWQDVHEDYDRHGRVYLPAEDLERFGVDPGVFAGEAYERLMSFEIERAHALLDAGARLVGTLRGRARLAVAGYVGGGRANLDALATGSPKASGRAMLAATLRTLVKGR